MWAFYTNRADLDPVTNFMNTAYFPISSAGAFDNLGMPYNISAVITPDGLFDEEKYRAYSPLFMSATLMLAYGTQFAVITAVIVHTLCEFFLCMNAKC